MSSLTGPSSAKELKLAILFHGLRIDPEALAQLQHRDAKFGHGLFDYSGTSRPSQIPQEVWLDDETVVRVHRRADSPYELTFPDGSLAVATSPGVFWPVRLSSRPRFYDLQLSDGSFGNQHCQINGGDRLNVYAFNFCAFTKRGVACQFCNVSDSGHSLETSLRKQAAKVARVVHAALAERAFNHFCFSGGAFPDTNKGAQVFLDICAAIREETGLSVLEGDISLVPPDDLAYIDLLTQTGVTTLSMNLEVLDEQLFSQICPGKDEIGLYHYNAAFERAVKCFEYGNVRSNLVLGLESLSSFKRGTRRLAEMGVVPTTNVYWQSTAQYLRHLEAEQLDYYREAYRWLGELYDAYGFDPPWCARCTIASMDHEAMSLA